MNNRIITIRKIRPQAGQLWRAFLSVILLFISLSGQAEDQAIDVSSVSGSLGINSSLVILEDPDSAFSLEQILEDQQAGEFKPASKEMNFGFSESTYWLKLELINPTEKPVSLVLHQDYPLIDFLDFWLVENGGVIRQVKTGDRKLFSAREIADKDFLFSIDLSPQASKTVVLRYQTEGALNISLSLTEKNHLIAKTSVENLAFGAYYGGFLVLAIYNMFLFLAVKEKAFVHYLWYLISYGVYMSTHNGLAFQFLWPNNPWLANQSLLVLLSLTLFWGLKFSQEILASIRFSPRLDQIGSWFQGLLAFAFLCSLVFPYALMVQVLSLLTVIECIYILIIGFKSLLAKYPPARYFMVAWSFLLIAVLVYMLKTYGLLPHNGYTQNAFQIASLFEMTLLSVALSYHFSELKKKSFTDSLTYLYNRRHFDDCFRSEFEQATHDQKPLSLLVLDIDHFKSFNDEFGHAQGDKVIQGVAEVLKNSVRKPLLPCRYGGEEFAVILPRTTHSDAMVLAERLREMVARRTNNKRHITVSIGVASLFGPDAEAPAGGSIDSPRALFEAADSALYQAKEAGRNRVESYNLNLLPSTEPAAFQSESSLKDPLAP